MLDIEILYTYPTFTVFLSIFLAMVITIVLMPLFIRLLKYRQIGQQIRADGPEHHLVKQGTPTMGGVILLVAILLTVVIMLPTKSTTQSLPMLVLVGVTVIAGLMGLGDDISKSVHKRSLGFTPAVKMLLLTALSVAFCLIAVNVVGISPVVTIPFVPPVDLGVLHTDLMVGDDIIVIPWLYMVFVFLLMAGMSNAVNLTDGLDGLAGGVCMIAFAAMAAIAFRENQANLAVFGAAVSGCCIGFLWFNTHPASVFMGDVGSLSLGAAFAGLAVFTKTEIIALVIGAVFVLEALSVIVQVVYFKLSKGKRVFLMAPLHHHFEQLGWSETHVVIRFWIMGGLFASLGFALYFANSL